MSWTLKNILKLILLLGVIRPFIWYFLGLNRYSRLKIPTKDNSPYQGPLIIASNHNSHLDTLLIAGLLPIDIALRTHFVAAADYFQRNKLLSWFLFNFLEMIPIRRPEKFNLSSSLSLLKHDPKLNDSIRDHLEPLSQVLKNNEVIVIYPEGTRGGPEQRSKFKKGIARLALRHPHVPIIPIFLRGPGKSLPRGEKIFVPLIPQVVYGEPLIFNTLPESSLSTSISEQNKLNEQYILQELELAFINLEKTVSTNDWVAL